MPSPRQARPDPRTRREARSGTEGRRPQPPRHALSTAAARRAQQRQARLARTVAVAITALSIGSALSGYLLHGGAQSARAAAAQPVSTTAASPVPSSTGGSPTPTASSAPPSSGPASPSTSTTKNADTSSAAQAIPSKGDGVFLPVQVPETTTARTGRVVTYSLRVEGGMHADPASVARDFGAALLDRRGWQGVDHVRFVQVTPIQLAQGVKPQVIVLVASPDEVSRLCAPLPTHGDTSCNTSKHVVLNYKLWMQGVTYFKGHVAEYRDYMVNHEVGHALGHGHQKCSAPGAYAPVMEQQTLGLQGCKAWPWPKRPNASGVA